MVYGVWCMVWRKPQLSRFARLYAFGGWTVYRGKAAFTSQRDKTSLNRATCSHHRCLTSNLSPLTL